MSSDAYSSDSFATDSDSMDQDFVEYSNYEELPSDDEQEVREVEVVDEDFVKFLHLSLEHYGREEKAIPKPSTVRVRLDRIVELPVQFLVIQEDEMEDYKMRPFPKSISMKQNTVLYCECLTRTIPHSFMEVYSDRAICEHRTSPLHGKALVFLKADEYVVRNSNFVRLEVKVKVGVRPLGPRSSR